MAKLIATGRAFGIRSWNETPPAIAVGERIRDVFQVLFAPVCPDHCLIRLSMNRVAALGAIEMGA